MSRTVLQQNAGLASARRVSDNFGGTPWAVGTEESPVTVASWKTQAYGCVQSLLFNNPHRVIRYLVRDERGGWQDRSQRPAPVRRLYETEAPPERSCLRTVQFVHHMAIPPGGRHVAE